MLIIRKEQVGAFNKAMLERFENLMVDHLAMYFPDQCEKMGEESVREAILYGMERAKTYGIIIEQDISMYLNLMFTFGRDFDKDSALTWMAEILNNENLGASSRMKVLYTEAEKNLSSAHGHL